MSIIIEGWETLTGDVLDDFTVDQLRVRKERREAEQIVGDGGAGPNPGLHDPDVGPHIHFLSVSKIPGRWLVALDGDEYDVPARYSRETLTAWYKRTGLDEVLEPETQPVISEGDEADEWASTVDLLVDLAGTVLDDHETMRGQWGRWFKLPDIKDCIFFILEELAEFANALRLNDGTYVRNRDGRHKAKEVNSELVDLLLMLHTLLLTMNQPLDLQELEMGLEMLEDITVDDTLIGARVSTLTKYALDHYVGLDSRVVAALTHEAMAAVLLYPDFAIVECNWTLEKWNKRAKGRQMMALADELGFTVSPKKEGK